MACEVFKNVIHNHDYTYTQRPATSSLKLKYELMKILGPAAGKLAEGLGGSDNEQLSVFGEAVSSIFENSDPDAVVSLVKRILQPAFRDGERIDLDRDYTGNLGEMYAALAWILSKEYGSFFGEVGKLLPELMTAEEPK